MVDIDKLLMGEDPAPRKRDRVDDLLEGVTPVQASIGGQEGSYLLQTGQEPTGAIDTRTSKPIMRPVPTGEQEAGMGSLIESKQVDDPQTRMRILAKNRGISPDRYGIVSGRIVYQGDDGKLYFEEPDTSTLGGLAKDVVATTAGHPEEVAMGTLMAPLGVAGAALGAAGGAGLRKVRGSLMYDEPQTELGNLKEMGVAGGTAAAGTWLGGKLIGGIDRTKGKQAATLMKLSGTERLRMNPTQIAEIDSLARKFGIELWVPETTGSHELIARFKFLGDIPVTADKIGQARMRRYGEVNKAINSWLDEFAPATTTPGEAGRRAVEAAETGIKAANTVRQNKARPFYTKAFESGAEVDVEPVLDLIKEEMKTAKGPILDHLENAKKLLLKPDLPKKGTRVAVEGGGEYDVPFTKAGEVSYDTGIEGLHGTKIALDRLIETANQSGLGNTIKRNYVNIKKKLLEQMDTASPDYKQARSIFSEESLIPEELSKTKIATLAKLEGDKVEGAARTILSPSQSSPEIVDMSKKAIIEYGGQEAWDALLRVHLKSKLREVVKTNTTNVGGMLRKKLVMDMDQYDILRTAMSKEQFDVFNDFMQVLERTGLTTGKESATAGRMVSQSQMEEEAGGIVGKALKATAYPLVTWKMMVADLRTKLRTERFQIMLADAMLDPKNTTKFRSMLQLQPESQKLIRQFSTFLTSVSEGELEEIAGQSTRQDVLPTTLQGRLATPQRLRGGRLEWLQ